jgi:hypothetical protein
MRGGEFQVPSSEFEVLRGELRRAKGEGKRVPSSKFRVRRGFVE